MKGQNKQIFFLLFTGVFYRSNTLEQLKRHLKEIIGMYKTYRNKLEKSVCTGTRSVHTRKTSVGFFCHKSVVSANIVPVEI